MSLDPPHAALSLQKWPECKVEHTIDGVFFSTKLSSSRVELYFLNKPRKLLCIKLEKFALDSDRNHNENDLSQVLKGAGGLLASFFQIRW